MRLTVIGCSGSVPGPDAACSGYLVERDGFRLLLEVGTGVAGAVQRYADAADLDAVIVSHADEDHCGDLGHLGYLRTLPATYRPLPVIGAADLPALVWHNPEVFAARAAAPGPRQLGPFTVRLSPVDHDRECWAARVGDELCFTADTRPCPALDDLAQGCAVLLAEASGVDGEAVGAHMTAGDAGRLAARSGARLLILTHLRPWQDHAALLDEAAAAAGCPVLLARPGLRVSRPGPR